MFGLQWVEDPQIRPDGREIAYVRMSYDIMSDRARQAIWLVDVETVHRRRSRAVREPIFHRAGRRMASGSRTFRPSREATRSCSSRWMQSGQAARITDLTEAPGGLAWSPDGRQIAFIMLIPDEKAKLGAAPAKPDGAPGQNRLTVITDVTYRADGAGYLTPGYSHAFVVPADGGFPRQLTFGEYNEDGPVSWTPDGRYLLLSGNRNEGWRLDSVSSQLYRVSVADAALTPLTSRVGPDQQPHVSPDGAKIAYLGFEDHQLGYQNVRLLIMDRDGKGSHSITDTLDRSVEGLQWAADSRRCLHSIYGQGGNPRRARFLSPAAAARR